MMGEMKMELFKRKDGGIRVNVITVDKPINGLLRDRREYYHKFRKLLDKAGEFSYVWVTINSAGGSLDSAMGMCAALAMINVPMRILIDGRCDSAATLLLELCAPVYITETSTIFMHNPSRQRFQRQKDGEYKLIATETWAMKLTRGYMMTTYRGRCKRSGKRQRKATVRGWMDAGTRFSAAEAVNVGLCDRIMSRYEFEKG